MHFENGDLFGRTNLHEFNEGYIPMRLLPPHHLVDDARIALDNLDDLGGNVLVYVVGHGDTVEAVLAKANGGVDCLKQAAAVDAGDDEATLVDGLGTLGAGADADGRDGFTDAGIEA